MTGLVDEMSEMEEIGVVDSAELMMLMVNVLGESSRMQMWNACRRL